MIPRQIRNEDDFLRILRHGMQSARKQAVSQARLAFKDGRYNVEKLVLIAMVGEWWSFRFVRASDVAETLSEESSPEEKQKKIKYHRSSQLMRHQALRSPLVEEPVANIDDAVPPGSEWSNNILFGTPASNQRLFLVHREIQSLKNAMVAQAEGMIREAAATLAEEVAMAGTGASAAQAPDTFHIHQDEEIGSGSDVWDGDGTGAWMTFETIRHTWMRSRANQRPRPRTRTGMRTKNECHWMPWAGTLPTFKGT
ncbi:hypothetical protein CPC08DRAFT_722236 [Agrocybe pediades]|nr:hypothetical protein CPC08DRAFT_722236 [Agrocybe pediades]